MTTYDPYQVHVNIARTRLDPSEYSLGLSAEDGKCIGFGEVVKQEAILHAHRDTQVDYMRYQNRITSNIPQYLQSCCLPNGVKTGFH